MILPSAFAATPTMPAERKGLRHALLRMQARSELASSSLRPPISDQENGRQRICPDELDRVATGTDAEIKAQARAIAKLTNSRQPRDFLHMIISAPKSENKEQFIVAAHDG